MVEFDLAIRWSCQTTSIWSGLLFDYENSLLQSQSISITGFSLCLGPKQVDCM